LRRELNIDVIWTGYQEDDLAEHYRAADVLLFTARGSDEGHRAILEAMACGVAPVTFPIEGVSALLGELALTLIATESTPESAAAKVIAASPDLASLRRRAYEQSQNFGYAQAAARLIDVYEGA
jgi:glycosyltransferase involved in cell wall biosynthesis